MQWSAGSNFNLGVTYWRYAVHTLETGARLHRTMKAANFSILNHLDQHQQQFSHLCLKLGTFYTDLVNIGSNLRCISYLLKTELPIRNMLEAMGQRAGRQALVSGLAAAADSGGRSGGSSKWSGQVGAISISG